MSHWFKILVVIACALSESVSAILCEPCDANQLHGFAYTPPLSYECDYCRWSGHFDYLYWKPDLRLNVASVLSTTTNGSLTNYTGEVKRLKFEWDSGFRVGIDYTLPFDAWEFNFIWTHFLTHYHDAELNLTQMPSNNVSNFQTITPLFNTALFRAPLTTQKMKNEAHIQFNVLDFLLQRPTLTNQCLTLTPFGGLRLLFDTNRYTSSFDIPRSPATPFASVVNSSFSYTNKYTGVGLVSGLKTIWDVFCGLEIEAFGSIGLLYGNTHVVNPSFNASIPLSNTTSYRFQELNYTLDGGIFLRWVENIWQGKGQFALKIGWEAHFVSDQNRLFLNTSGNPLIGAGILQVADSGYVKESPLTLQGLVIGISASM